MKMKGLFFTLLLASFISNADAIVWKKVGSDYTSLKNCKQIPTDEDDIL